MTRSCCAFERSSSYELLIVDEVGFVPFSKRRGWKTGAELLFKCLANAMSTAWRSNQQSGFRRVEQSAWRKAAHRRLLDRLSHHVHIVEMTTASASNRAGVDASPPTLSPDVPGTRASRSMASSATLQTPDFTHGRYLLVLGIDYSCPSH